MYDDEVRGGAQQSRAVRPPHQGLRVRQACGPVNGPGVAKINAPDEILLSIVSNSCLMREGLVALLSEHALVQLVGSYAGTPCGAAPLPNPTGHVVLLDGGMSNEATVAWTRFWSGLSPPAHVLVVDLIHNVDLILVCIEAGASGYLLEGDSSAEVMRAITWMQQERAEASPEVIARLFAQVAASKVARPPLAPIPLSSRELEIVRWIAEDYSNQEIAEQLVVQLCTVKHHVHNILEKLKLRTRWDAARLAIEQGWLDDNDERMSPGAREPATASG
jgi:DNA-binding NarL/FixJ family response regulator